MNSDGGSNAYQTRSEVISGDNASSRIRIGVREFVSGRGYRANSTRIPRVRDEATLLNQLYERIWHQIAAYPNLSLRESFHNKLDDNALRKQCQTDCKRYV